MKIHKFGEGDPIGPPLPLEKEGFGHARLRVKYSDRFWG